MQIKQVKTEKIQIVFLIFTFHPVLCALSVLDTDRRIEYVIYQLSYIVPSFHQHWIMSQLQTVGVPEEQVLFIVV